MSMETSRSTVSSSNITNDSSNSVKEEENNACQEECESRSISDVFPIETQHKLSLKFRCEDTSPSQRKLCQRFWEAIDRNPDFNRILAKGWSETELSPPGPESNTKKPQSLTPCDELKRFIDRNVDKLAMLDLKSKPDDCLHNVSSMDSITQIFTDIDQFDITVKPECSIPPKTPKRTCTVLTERPVTDGQLPRASHKSGVSPSHLEKTPTQLKK